jgi:hypothetical protein
VVFDKEKAGQRRPAVVLIIDFAPFELALVGFDQAHAPSTLVIQDEDEGGPGSGEFFQFLQRTPGGDGELAHMMPG